MGPIHRQLNKYRSGTKSLVVSHWVAHVATLPRLETVYLYGNTNITRTGNVLFGYTQAPLPSEQVQYMSGIIIVLLYIHGSADVASWGSNWVAGVRATAPKLHAEVHCRSSRLRYGARKVAQAFIHLVDGSADHWKYNAREKFTAKCDDPKLWTSHERLDFIPRRLYTQGERICPWMARYMQAAAVRLTGLLILGGGGGLTAQ